MKRFIKTLALSVLAIVILAGIAVGLFVYKITYGFPVSYEVNPPAISIPPDKTTVLLFTKATGYRHSESIEAGKLVFDSLAKAQDWFLFETEEGGVFNKEQLSSFDVVVFNNCTGRLLNDEQQRLFEAYIQNGGAFIGIHGAGDNSHHWPWYEQNLIGAPFSHHPMNPQLQTTQVQLDAEADPVLARGLAARWQHQEEWYIFKENPRDNDFRVLWAINGNQINPNGNILWIRNKLQGMGQDHPVAWSKRVGQGQSFYTSLGHDTRAWKNPQFIQMLLNAVTASAPQPNTAADDG